MEVSYVLDYHNIETPVFLFPLDHQWDSNVEGNQNPPRGNLLNDHGCGGEKQTLDMLFS